MSIESRSMINSTIIDVILIFLRSLRSNEKSGLRNSMFNVAIVIYDWPILLDVPRSINYPLSIIMQIVRIKVNNLGSGFEDKLSKFSVKRHKLTQVFNHAEVQNALQISFLRISMCVLCTSTLYMFFIYLCAISIYVFPIERNTHLAKDRDEISFLA